MKPIAGALALWHHMMGGKGFLWWIYNSFTLCWLHVRLSCFICFFLACLQFGCLLGGVHYEYITPADSVMHLLELSCSCKYVWYVLFQCIRHFVELDCMDSLFIINNYKPEHDASPQACMKNWLEHRQQTLGIWSTYWWFLMLSCRTALVMLHRIQSTW